MEKEYQNGYNPKMEKTCDCCLYFHHGNIILQTTPTFDTQSFIRYTLALFETKLKKANTEEL
ncbi:hypothetical protein JMM81_15510 [Bacillus sp. V3B]|uniref:hypothetical protein n=1 Tax=Bacillus sp. V3B TaxID=2804915 RepID=UPI0021088CAF|nr:hypothetical protein [Bacillus sp. V3B]MCQ6276327.1 hypothetical protein [Bacillus sp. V3B]